MNSVVCLLLLCEVMEVRRVSDSSCVGQVKRMC